MGREELPNTRHDYGHEISQNLIPFAGMCIAPRSRSVCPQDLQNPHCRDSDLLTVRAYTLNYTQDHH